MPTGVAVFPMDVSIRRTVELEHTVVHWSEFARGGHFAAMEAPFGPGTFEQFPPECVLTWVRAVPSHRPASPLTGVTWQHVVPVIPAVNRLDR